MVLLATNITFGNRAKSGENMWHMLGMDIISLD
jgi:hypothetical protein